MKNANTALVVAGLATVISLGSLFFYLGAIREADLELRKKDEDIAYLMALVEKQDTEIRFNKLVAGSSRV